MDKAKIEAFVDANIKAVHAYEVLASKKLGEKIRSKYWNTAGVPDAELKKLVELHKAMLAEPVSELAAWAAGEKSAFDGSKHLDFINASKLTSENPKLPLNVWLDWLKIKAPTSSQIERKTVANIQQVLSEVERDGDLLQDLFRVYAKIGLPVLTGQLGITGETDEDFLAWGTEISENIGFTPYSKDPEAVQMAFRKMYNWGRRFTGLRDKFVLGKELLSLPEVTTAIPLFAKQPQRKIAVIGHSFTMETHWSTPASFIPIVTELTKLYNPKSEFKYFQQGGMSAVTAQRLFYSPVLEWKPDLVVFVIMGEGPENRKALREMILGYTAAGIKCCIFDSLWPADWDLLPKGSDPELKDLKLNIIEVKKILEASPEKEKFKCLDGIHLTEPWHMLMAREWFKYLAGARKEKPE